jgi:hypothetical protein
MLRLIAPLALITLSALVCWSLVDGLSNPVAGAPAPRGAQTILDCNFDDKPLNQIIGTGGAAANEPVSLGGVAATIRSTPLPTPSLQMIDDWGSGAKAVRFQFLDDVEITTGIVETKMSVVFDVLDRYAIYFREVGSSASSILTLEFEANGEIYYKDLDTSPSTMIGTYTARTKIPIRIRHDIDQNEWSLKVDEVVLVDGDSIGPMTTGIGSILIGLGHDVNSIGMMSLDDLMVSATDAPTAVDATSWGKVKSLYR